MPKEACDRSVFLAELQVRFKSKPKPSSSLPLSFSPSLPPPATNPLLSLSPTSITRRCWERFAASLRSNTPSPSLLVLLSSLMETTFLPPACFSPVIACLIGTAIGIAFDTHSTDCLACVLHMMAVVDAHATDMYSNLWGVRGSDEG